VPVATLNKRTLCASFGGLSKVYRACGYRVGWVSFSGPKEPAKDYLLALDLMCGLRLCSNVPGQWAVQTALGGRQSIYDLTKPGGRLYETRRAVAESLATSKYLEAVTPQGALYVFVRVRAGAIPHFDDQKFALDLLEKRHVLITPGHGFNVPYKDAFRITLLPDAELMAKVLKTIDEACAEYVHA